MANMTAPNGTIHSINAERGKSHCGRVVVGAADTKKTRKETTCGRCDQLNPALRETTVVVPAAKAVSTPASKRAGRVTAAKADVTPESTPVRRGVKKVRASKAAVTVTQDDDVQDIYAAFMYLLAANKADASIEQHVTGSAVTFEHDGYTYMVWHPRYNTGGADEWRIQWVDGDFSSDNGTTEDFDTMEDALSWLIEDTGFTAAKVPPAPVRKPGRKAVAATNGSDGAHLTGAAAGHVRNALTSLSKLPDGSMTKDQARLVAASVKALWTLV